MRFSSIYLFTVRRKSVLFKKGEGEDPEYASQANYSISECFEAFLSKKLLPCLRREPGWLNNYIS